MSSDKEYRTSEGLGYDMRMKPEVIVKFKLVVKLPAASVGLLYHCNQRGKFFLFRNDSTVFSMKKRLTSGAIEHDMEVYSTNVKRNYHPCEVTKYLNINNMPKKLAH